MHILYIDASGDPGWCPPIGRSRTRWYVVSGICLNQYNWKKTCEDTKNLLTKYFGWSLPSSRELHRGALIAGATPFDILSPQDRINLDYEVFDMLCNIKPVLFSMAVDKIAHRQKYGISAFPPDEWGFRMIATRYQKYLERIGDQGIVMMDSESKKKNNKYQILLESARAHGIVVESIIPDPHMTNNNISNILENVWFVDSKESFPIQLSDSCCHAVFSKLERNQPARFNQIWPLFDNDKGTVYGYREWSPRTPIP